MRKLRRRKYSAVIADNDADNAYGLLHYSFLDGMRFVPVIGPSRVLDLLRALSGTRNAKH